MEDSQQRRLNKYQAESAFMMDNAADFPKGTPGDKTVIALRAQIDEIESLAGQQRSQAARSNLGIKDDLFDNLELMMRRINRAAKALEDEVPGISDLFRMPRNRTEENRLATARAFYTAAAPYQGQFEEYDLPADFREDLTALITQIEQTQTAADIGKEQTGGATGGIVATLREAGKQSRKLGAIVKNKYYNNPQKLAGWAIASHLEAAPQKPKP